MEKVIILSKKNKAIISTAGLLCFFFSYTQAQTINQLWGMTNAGSDSGGGAIFKYNIGALNDSIVESFTAPGANPGGNLIEGTDGNLYGVTSQGGTWGLGCIFKCTTTGEETILYSFKGGDSDGACPYGSLLQASDGNLYGMTCGSFYFGPSTIFKCTPSGIETTLHIFGNTPDGIAPRGSLIEGSDGNLYGMTADGGASSVGTIFKCTTSGVETVLHSFTGGNSDGSNPMGSLIQASDGNLYGMTPKGGAPGYGTIFTCSTTGSERVLYAFAGGASDGQSPYGSLIQGSDGNLYGMTTGEINGWTSNTLCYGTIFKCTTSGIESTIYAFGTNSGDGDKPYGSLIQGSDGNLYGMTSMGGNLGYGNIFECSTSGAEKILHFFTGSASDGQFPDGGLIQGSDGNLYGMTSQGGAMGYGTIIKCTTLGTESLLYSFTGDVYGGNPIGNLIQGSDSNFYGMTPSGGLFKQGTIFKCTPSGTKTILHNFIGGDTDGSYPMGSLVQAKDGNFYGMTYDGGPFIGGGCLNYSVGDEGTIFKCTPAGKETILHIFAGGAEDGESPEGNLIQGIDGKLYGMTSGGGISGGTYPNGSSGGAGIIFQITTTGNMSILYNFMGGDNDGASPDGSLIQDSNGIFYGMTCQGGPLNYGTIFEFNPATSKETIMHFFANGSSDGASPYGSVVADSNGNLYGMTSAGGVWGFGTIFKCTKAGIETILHSFSGSPDDGSYPLGSLILGSDGNFYGMTTRGGVSRTGVLFECTPSGQVTILKNFTGLNGSSPYGDLLEVKRTYLATPTLKLPDNIVVYPNPSNGAFNLAVSGKEQGISKVDVYNMLGEKIYSNTFTITNSAFSIDLSSQPNGVYLYRILNGDGSMAGEGKMVIQK